jgi:topoisomerase IA-like protein
MNNVSDGKVQSVTGHKTKRMMEHYTHFDSREFTEVRQVQSNLFVNVPANTPTKIITDGEAINTEPQVVEVVKEKTVKTKTSKKAATKPKTTKVNTAKRPIANKPVRKPAVKIKAKR